MPHADYKIAIISPSESFAETARMILKKRKLLIPVYIATGQKTLDLATRLIASGVKFIISRGRNALLLREAVSISVFDVNYTYEDVFYSYREALKYSDNIAFIGFDLAREAAIRFREISGVPLVIPHIKNVGEIDDTVAGLKEHGVGVLIGGHTTREAAEKWGIQCVETVVDGAAIKAVLNEALHFVRVDIEQQRNQLILHEVFQSTNIGIIAVTKEKQVLFANALAKQLLKAQLKKFIADCFANQELFEGISKGSSIHDYIEDFENDKFSIDFVPIFINKRFNAIVVNIRSMAMVFSSEKEIRRNLLAKSYQAKMFFSDVLGKSVVIRTAILQAKKYAQTNSTVLITGESGTGKEVFAQSIHNYSNRSKEAFVALNCAAIPENILESELFGYVKGAFTGARNEGKEGLFELAHRGTIFLDEIGEISMQVQVKLLRVLQEREITRIGDTKTIPIDVRIIAATNRNLIQQVKEKKFREDLFYRIAVLPLKLSPLRDRKEDIMPLVHFILKEYNRTLHFSAKAQELLCAYDYPGNIRQLRNIVERSIVMAEFDFVDEKQMMSLLEVEPDFLPVQNAQTKPDLQSMNRKIKQTDRGLVTNTLADYEKDRILDCLEINKGNKAATARELGVSKTTLWRRLQEYGL
jgi:transcriptional regulator with PAS, ATPase and Fis domain